MDVICLKVDWTPITVIHRLDAALDNHTMGTIFNAFGYWKITVERTLQLAVNLNKVVRGADAVGSNMFEEFEPTLESACRSVICRKAQSTASYRPGGFHK
jgi:hypothetical protein